MPNVACRTCAAIVDLHVKDSLSSHDSHHPALISYHATVLTLNKGLELIVVHTIASASKLISPQYSPDYHIYVKIQLF